MDKDWFIYLLEYGDKDPFTQALRACFDEMADWASQGNSVVIKGTNPVHFNDEVLSWHNIGGLRGEDILPAIMVSTINPHVFNEYEDRTPVKYKPSDKLIIISLRDLATNGDQVYSSVKKIMSELKSAENLTGLSIIKTENSFREKFVNAFQLKPSFFGVGIDIKQLLS